MAAISTLNIRVNEGIRSQTVRLIDEKGEQLGVVAIADAQQKAEKAGLDLVEVAPLAKPPVCRIIDFGKYAYENEKKERTAKKKQAIIHVKELRFRPKIGDHDYQTKLRSAQKFLSRGDRVKVTMMFRGREITHVESGQAVLNRLIDDLKELATVEKNFGLEHRSIVCILMPTKSTVKKPPKKSDDAVGVGASKPKKEKKGS